MVSASTPLTAGALLSCFGALISVHDWAGLRAILTDDAQMTYAHTGETFDPAAFVALVRDYPGDWVFHVDEVVDGGSRGVLRSRTVVGDDVFHCATFASVAGDRLTDLVEIWTGPVAPHPRRGSSKEHR